MPDFTRAVVEPPPLAHFRGYVFLVEHDGCWVCLTDQDRYTPDEEVFVKRSAFREADQSFLREGAIFDWLVWEGRNDLQIVKEPRWTAAVQQKANAWAERLRRRLTREGVEWRCAP